MERFVIIDTARNGKILKLRGIQYFRSRLIAEVEAGRMNSPAFPFRYCVEPWEVK